MRYTIILLLTLLAGCANTAPIPEKYRPLETLSGRPDFLAPDTTATTVGKTVYVADVEKWLKERPEGTVRYDSIMQHERVHSYRQLKLGVGTWLSRYASSAAFRWKEEQLGWYIQIQLLRRGGFQINVDGVAKSLSGYKPFMVSYEDARQWVLDVLAGRWKPASDEMLPEDLQGL